MKKFVFLLWAFTFSAWAAPEMPDANLMQQLNVGREEGQLLKADQIRVLRPADFPEVTLVGFLTGPNDCVIGSALVDNKLVKPSEACGIALRAHGWEGLAGPQKIALALQWLEQAQLGFGETLIRTKPPRFGDRWTKYNEIETLANLSGSVRIVAWIESAPNGEPRRRFHRNVYWFAKDGALLRSKILDSYEMGPT